MQQISFAIAEHQNKKRITKREKFLAEMAQVVPWQRLIDLIEPHYPKGRRGRPPSRGDLHAQVKFPFGRIYFRCPSTKEKEVNKPRSGS